MMLPLKIVFVLLLVIVAPVLFYRLNKLLASVFLKERDVSPRWKQFMRMNLGLVVLVYVLVGAGIGNAVLGYLEGTGGDTQLISRDIIAAETKVPGDLISPAPLPASQSPPDHGGIDQSESGYTEPDPTEPKAALQVSRGKVSRGYQAAQPAVDGYIHMGNRLRFGVNWKQVPQGLKITRISRGSMKQAGIRMGDVITHLDLHPLNEEAVLLKRRNDVFYRKVEFVELTVRRSDSVLKYRLIR